MELGPEGVIKDGIKEEMANGIPAKSEKGEGERIQGAFGANSGNLQGTFGEEKPSGGTEDEKKQEAKEEVQASAPAVPSKPKVMYKLPPMSSYALYEAMMRKQREKANEPSVATIQE
jgi:hypothetical protein